MPPRSLAMFSRFAVYFKQRILVADGDTKGGVKKPSVMFAFNPPLAGSPGQWITLKSKFPCQFLVNHCV